MAGNIGIGCSGWSYPHWRKRFYPEKMPAREHFAFYAQHFNTVELNNSFYRQPPLERFIAWREQASPEFLFAVKGSRYVTHIKLLRAHRIALCVPDHPKMPKSFEITSDFTYIRMHLPAHGLGYGERGLHPWGERVVDWRRAGLDVFMYFNNDMEGHAVKDAKTLISLITAKGVAP